VNNFENDIKKMLISQIESFDFENDFINDVLTNTQISYSDFFELAINVYDSLLKDIEESQIVCVLENSLDLVLLYFSVMVSNKSIIVIDPQKSKEEIDNIIDEVDDKRVFVDLKSSDKVSKYDQVVCFKNVKNIRNYDVQKKLILLFQKRDFNSKYLTTYTSGTTGFNKGVSHSLLNLLFTAFDFNKKVNLSEDCIFGHVMPMTYMAGVLNSIIQPFLEGSKIVLFGRFNTMMAINFWSVIGKFNVNTFWVSPGMLTLIDRLGKVSEGVEYCKKNNVVFFVGTAPLSVVFQKEFENKYGAKLYASYGLSETLYVSAQTDLSKENMDVSNVGVLLDHIEFKLSADNELLIKTPWMFLGYTNDITEDYFYDEYYKTGDFAEIKDGNLIILGRKKDLIIRGGMNISPLAIENVLIDSKVVSDCAVFGIVDLKNSDEKIVLAYSRAIDNSTNTMSILCNSIIKEKLGSSYLIDNFFEIGQIPKNKNGKTDKNVMKEMYLNINNDN
jgi:long-chain acyl-CoA synthetase